MLKCNHMLMTTNPLQETFTLDQVSSQVAGPLGSTYKSIGVNILKGIGRTILGIISTALYLILLIPQLLQLIVFLLVMYVVSKLWGSMKSLYEIFAALFNALIPGPLIAWNIIAGIFNLIGKALKLVKIRLPSLPVVGNPFRVKLPKKMPTAIEFVMMVLGPVANATKNSVHGFVYA